MPAPCRSDPGTPAPCNGGAPAPAGQFGPNAYTDWRATGLGAISEAIERRLVLRLAGEVNGCNVLDVGCGDGALALAFWRSGATAVVGCDIDPQMIARATSEAVRHKAAIDYALAGAEHLPFRDQSFDIVTLITVLAFIPKPEIALGEIARVLKPGGRLVIGDLGKWSLWAASRRIRGWLGVAPMWNAARFRSAGELRALVQAAQLRVEHLSGAVYYPRCQWIARQMAGMDPSFGELTTFGAAFLAIRATKA
jgi:ubiquinone/menaquinone biosynthesis C-methylase UbiE